MDITSQNPLLSNVKPQSRTIILEITYRSFVFQIDGG